MSIWRHMLIGFLDGLLEPTDSDDPFNGNGRQYFADPFMTDEDYRDYIQAHNANDLAGAFNHRTGMWDDGFDPAGIYDDNEWLPGPIGIYDDDD